MTFFSVLKTKNIRDKLPRRAVGKVLMIVMNKKVGKV